MDLFDAKLLPLKKENLIFVLVMEYAESLPWLAGIGDIWSVTPLTKNFICIVRES